MALGCPHCGELQLDDQPREWRYCERCEREWRSVRVWANPLAGWIDAEPRWAWGSEVQHGDHHTTEKEQGWQKWLRRHHLWDETMSEDELHTRYMKFSRISFGVVPE